MNIFRQYTKKNLRKNKTRTLVTIVGIALSMALFTAVIEAAYSGVQYLLNVEIAVDGSWNGCYLGLDDEQAERLESRTEVKDFSEVSNVGWTEITNGQESKKVPVKSLDNNIENLVGVEIIEGRMPENSSEIMLPKDCIHRDSDIDYKVGDKISLDVGKVDENEKEYSWDMDGTDVKEIVKNAEKITDAQTKNYTIVGIYNNYNLSINANNGVRCAAFTSDTEGESKDVFFALKSPRKYNDFVSSVGITAENMPHSALLDFYGKTETTAVIYLFAGILCIMVVVASIALIYNSFSISVSERTKQFGILKSIGATKKQIRSVVYHEVLCLNLIAIPIGLILGLGGIGTTFYLLRGVFLELFSERFGEKSDAIVSIHLVIAPLALLIASILCIITTFISAYIPTRRAMRISAIDSIRQTKDIKIKDKSVKTSPITKKLFGFEGMMASKNFKRNKKRYRATIFSLFLSVVLFISATSFSENFKYAVETLFSIGPKADISAIVSLSNSKALEKNITMADLHKLLLSAEGVTDGLYANRSAENLNFDADIVSASYKKHINNDVQQVDLYFVNDANFRDVCKDNGISYEEYFDKNNPKALLQNRFLELDKCKHDKIVDVQFIDKQKLPCILYEKVIKKIDGYTYVGSRRIEGKDCYIYGENSYVESHKKLGVDEIDLSQAIVLTQEEAYDKMEFKVNDVIEKVPFALGIDNAALIYPMSMRECVIDDKYFEDNTWKCLSYMSSNPHKTFKQMEKLLKEHELNLIVKLVDETQKVEMIRTMIIVTNVFVYGFIILMALISIANVFNAVSTSIFLRKQEFAMLKSVGMSRKSFNKMMRYECIIYGLKSLIFGLPISVAIVYFIYKLMSKYIITSFFIPWYSIAIAVGSVFIVVFITMIYATSKIKNDNPIDALKNENI